jgi:tetratricopeptide (TPR) repeat protein
MPGISDWLRRDTMPRNHYELLGHPLLDPDRDALLASLRKANRELLDYQSHDDRAVAARAMGLITELGRTRGIFEDRAKHQAYDDGLIVALREEFARDRAAGLARSEADLPAWLASRYGLDPFFANHVAKRLRVEPERPEVVELVEPPPMRLAERPASRPAFAPHQFHVAERNVEPPRSRPASAPRRTPDDDIVPLLSAAEPEADEPVRIAPWVIVVPWGVAAAAVMIVLVLAFVSSRRGRDAAEARNLARQAGAQEEAAVRELASSRQKWRAEQSELEAVASRNSAEVERFKSNDVKQREEIDRLAKQVTMLTATQNDAKQEAEDYARRFDDLKKAKDATDAVQRRFHIATDLYNDRKDDLAFNEVNEVLRLDPKHARALILRSHIHYLRKQEDKALQDCDAAVRSDPLDPRAHFYRGNAHSRAKNYAAAIADYTEALRLAPQLEMALENRGRARLRLKDYVKALADFDAVLQLNPKAANAHAGRSWAWAGRGEFDKALKEINTAIQLDPKDGGFHYDKACCLAVQQQKDAAFAALQQAFELGFRNFEHVEMDPDLDSIRSDARFKPLLDKYRSK